MNRVGQEDVAADPTELWGKKVLTLDDHGGVSGQPSSKHAVMTANCAGSCRQGSWRSTHISDRGETMVQ
jgi:hypothetical protein